MLPGYELREPTEEDAVAALQRVFGADRGTELWAEACRAARVAPGRIATEAGFQGAVQALKEQGGATGMVARSIEIRLRTYARIAARMGLTPGGQE